MTEFSGAARRITIHDIEDAAQRIGCEVAALRAVIEVESKRSGFDEKRRPAILFEPHVFYRSLSIKDLKTRKLIATPERDRAVAAGLAYPRWGEKSYPKSSNGNYARLVAAIQIDEEAAFKSISVGLGQVLGENHEAAGFPSAKDMFEAARDGEAEQLAQMIGFIEDKHLDDELRRRDWTTFAAVYNGKGQVSRYAARLSEAYAKWKEIDVPREALTAHELRRAGSRTIAGADQARGAATKIVTTIGGMTALEIADKAQDISTAFQSLSDATQSSSGLLSWGQQHWQLVAIAALAMAAGYFAWRIRNGADIVTQARVDDARMNVNARI